MPAYIIDTQKFKIAQTYPDTSYSSFAMSDNYGWEPDNRYKVIEELENIQKAMVLFKRTQRK